MSDVLTPNVFPRNVQFFRELSPLCVFSPRGSNERDRAKGIERRGSNEGDRTKGLGGDRTKGLGRKGSNERARSQRVEK
jgi:hypothetical protein